MGSGMSRPRGRREATPRAPGAAPSEDRSTSDIGEETASRRRGYLPHWERAGATYFVTFRLADALPRHIVEAWEAELHPHAQSASPTALPPSTPSSNAILRRRSERYLDMGAGACYLAQPEIAEIVARTLRHFDGDRYTLLCWCVMPNHVHVVFRSHAGYPLASVVHSWKSFSAGEANRLLGRTGTFWQREYYDHLVRDERDLTRIIEYVAGNPSKAHLRDWRWVETYAERLTAVDAPPS